MKNVKCHTKEKEPQPTQLEQTEVLKNYTAAYLESETYSRLTPLRYEEYWTNATISNPNFRIVE